MGQAKRRGTFEQRKAESIERRKESIRAHKVIVEEIRAREAKKAPKKKWSKFNLIEAVTLLSMLGNK